MRIGEIAVVGPRGAGKADFITTLCPEVELNDKAMHLGRIPISDQLVLYIYGIHGGRNIPTLVWDLVAKKMLGVIVLFRWNEAESFADVQYIIDFLTSRFDTPLVIAANVSGQPGQGRDNQGFSIPKRIYEGGIDLAYGQKFTFCRTDDPKSVREVVVQVIDIAMNRVP